MTKNEIIKSQRKRIKELKTKLKNAIKLPICIEDDVYTIKDNIVNLEQLVRIEIWEDFAILTLSSGKKISVDFEYGNYTRNVEEMKPHNEDFEFFFNVDDLKKRTKGDKKIKFRGANWDYILEEKMVEIEEERK